MKRKTSLICLVLFFVCIFPCCNMLKFLHKEAELIITFSPNPVNRGADGHHHFNINFQEIGGVGAILKSVDVYPGTWPSDPHAILGFTRIGASQTRSTYINAWDYSSGTVLTFSFRYDDENGNQNKVLTGSVTLN